MSVSREEFLPPWVGLSGLRQTPVQPSQSHSSPTTDRVLFTQSSCRRGRLFEGMLPPGFNAGDCVFLSPGLIERLTPSISTSAECAVVAKITATASRGGIKHQERLSRPSSTVCRSGRTAWWSPCSHPRTNRM